MKPTAQRLSLGKMIKNRIFRFIFDVSSFLFRILPLDTSARFMGWFSAYFGWRYYPRIDVMKRSVQCAFPQFTSQQVQDVLQKSLGNAGRMFVEAVHIKTFFFRERDKRINVAISPSVEKFFNDHAHGLDDRPFIAVSGHTSWLGIIPLLERLKRKSLGLIYKKNIFNDQFWETACKLSNFCLLPNENTYSRASAFLKQGNSIMVFVDKRVRSGALVTFFNETIHMTHLAALLSINHNAVIIPMWTFRRGKTSVFDIAMGDIIAPTIQQAISKKEELRCITQKIAHYIETQVRKSPSDWFWMSKEVNGLFL